MINILKHLKIENFILTNSWIFLIVLIVAVVCIFLKLYFETYHWHINKVSLGILKHPLRIPKEDISNPSGGNNLALIFWGIGRKRDFCFSFEDINTEWICSFQNSFSVYSVSNPQSWQVTSPEKESLVAKGGLAAQLCGNLKGLSKSNYPNVSFNQSVSDLTFILIIFYNTNQVASQLSL